VAVFPSRLNARIANQHAAFTIHGGKYYEENNKILEKDKVPPRKSLMDLSRLFIKENRAPFLDVYIVPSCARRKLREQLKRLGVHRASVLPELEYQAEHIRNQWRFGMDK